MCCLSLELAGRLIFDVGGWITSSSELVGSPETTPRQLGFAGCLSRVHWGLFGCSRAHRSSWRCC
uniref:Putative ovule protein n=1 Tax=Solanum chacoense TaxID=4108 RepID=A0A0V0H4H7_SOLCH